MPIFSSDVGYVVGSILVVVAFLFLFMTRTAQPHNLESLKSYMTDVIQSGLTYLEQEQSWNESTRVSSVVISTSLWESKTAARQKYDRALKALDSQRMIADIRFRHPIEDFMTAINQEIERKSHLMSDYQQEKQLFEKMKDSAIREIENINRPSFRRHHNASS